MRIWMPSAGMVQPVARAMVMVGAEICGRGGDVGGTGEVGVTGDARTSAASGAMSGASVAPAVAQAVIAARSVSVMLE